MRSVLRSCVCFLVLVCSGLCDAGDQAGEAASSAPNAFRRGAIEMEFVAGAFFSVDSGYSSRPTINLASQNLRFGVMLSDPGGSGVLAGNAELLVEAMVGEVFTGPGSTIAGGTAILRYNFVHPHRWFTPYCQLGVGGSYNDISDTESQALLGSEVQFLLEADLGIRAMLNDRLSLVVEGGLLHLSNAGTTERNHGLNCLGGSAGLAFSF
jgi:hypothetical protein